MSSHGGTSSSSILRVVMRSIMWFILLGGCHQSSSYRFRSGSSPSIILTRRTTSGLKNHALVTKNCDFNPFPSMRLFASLSRLQSTPQIEIETEIETECEEQQPSSPPQKQQPQLPQQPQSLYQDSRYTQEEIRLLWREHEHLLTIGSIGVKDSHKNSTHDLTNGHNYVKIKVATDKLNATAIANEIVHDNRLINKVHIVEIRPKGFLLARSQLLPEKKKSNPKTGDEQTTTGGTSSSRPAIKTANKRNKLGVHKSSKGTVNGIQRRLSSTKSKKVSTSSKSPSSSSKNRPVNPPRSARKPRLGR